MLTEGQQVKVEGATGDRETVRGRKGKVVRVQKRYEGGLYPFIHVLLDDTKRPHVFMPFELIVDYDDMREMIANLDRGRLRAEAMEVKEMEEESIVEFYLLAKAMGLSVKELEEAVVWLGARFRGEQ